MTMAICSLARTQMWKFVAEIILIFVRYRQHKLLCLFDVAVKHKITSLSYWAVYFIYICFILKIPNPFMHIV